MATVKFRIQRQASMPLALTAPLQVTIRNLKTVITARGLTEQPIEVAPGRYTASVELPDGSTVVEQVDVEETSQTFELYASEIDEYAKLYSGTPHPSGEPAGNAAIVVRPHRRFSMAAEPDSEDASVALSACSAVGLHISPGGRVTRTNQFWDVAGEPGSLASVNIAGENRPGRFAMLSCTGAQGVTDNLAVAIPAAEGWGVEFALQRGLENDPVQLRAIARLENETSNALLVFIGNQSYSGITAYAERDVGGGFRDLLYAKRSDPVGAAIGGYGLLSLNSFTPLQQWSANLAQLAPWLPDAYAICGETQARLGNHDAAAVLFHKLVQTGIPVFSVGLSFAEARIRKYAHHKMPSADAAAEMNTWLQEISNNVLPKLKLGEILTTIVDPTVEGP